MKKSRPGNVGPKPTYDPLPKPGLVKQYEPLIREELGKFCSKYEHLSYADVLFDARAAGA